MTTHTTGDGKVIPIADMNDYHLHNAIKKLAAKSANGGQAETMAHAGKLAELRAEQQRRGGPPGDVK